MLTYRRSLLCAALAALWTTTAGAEVPFRPPATPLIAHDPYFSIWSVSDRITDEPTVHWTGKPNTILGLIRVDGKRLRVLGRSRYDGTPAMQQTGLTVLPTRTIYRFSEAGVNLEVVFFTPALPKDLDVLSRPVTYIEWTASSADGQPHAVQVYFDAASDITVNTPDEPVAWTRLLLDGAPVLRIGSREQRILAKRGDDLRIDWGYLYLMADRTESAAIAVAQLSGTRGAFANTGKLDATDDFATRVPGRRGTDDVLAVAFDFGSVGAKPVTRYVMLGYDDLYSIEYFERRLRPWWRRNGAEMSDALRSARQEHDSLLARSKAFDAELVADLRRVGGENYANLAVLAYRQTLAAHKLVADHDGSAMFFPKENFSNGCISTVDVIYPSSPFTMLFSPALLRAQLRPVLEYAGMARWPWRYAPHDLGTYPMANGQVYGGGEKHEHTQMPVEESANMIVMAAALAQIEGHAGFAQQYWPVLAKWAGYLKEKGLDPENQLTTDDFAGRMAHNANLSVKAILALGSFGRLCEMTGRKREAGVYAGLSRSFAQKWTEMAKDGSHYKLAFDKPGTWSMKYNLVWDRILGLNLFPAEVAREEVAYYLTKVNPYGLPLDYRKDYTKVDWTVWTATLAEDRADFDKFIAPLHRWAHESPSRVPLTDWYDTRTGLQQSGCQARSVVGGIFIKMLTDPLLWKKYSNAAK